ncbi:uncharacterized protein PAC_14652 [Phialocephala subalpina]|uniref:Uncharacterized protein n=1 Tax=Phialocephala subalpina TaxID=576137 RepID=A0A1L7XI93_9HELO|nr:uncharacterized protein PAC_14652 [Phialocephala subalpina]
MASLEAPAQLNVRDRRSVAYEAVAEVDNGNPRVEPLPDEGRENEQEVEKDRKRRKERKESFDKAVSDIVLAACLIVLLTVVISAVFIGIVFHFRVAVPSDAPSQASSFHSPTLVNNTQSIDTALFVDIDAARLVTIASWTSTAVSFIPPWVMLLFSYPVARHFLQGDRKKLPTSFQLRLIIELCTGDYGSLWSWFLYKAPRSKRNRRNPLMAMAAGLLLLCLVLGLCIVLADTWLHLTTTTVLLQETILVTDIPTNFSRSLTPSCARNAFGCTAHIPTYYDFPQGLIYNVSNAYNTLFNLSADTRILSTTANGQIFSFYASAGIPDNVTYRASTFALNTQCSAITRACNMTAQHACTPCESQTGDQQILPFNCSANFTGDMTGKMEYPVHPAFYNSTLTDSNFFLTYFNDAALTNNTFPTMVVSDNITYFISTNPSYFAAGANVAVDPALMSDPNIVILNVSATGAFLLECSSQVLQMTYTFSSDSGVTDIEVSPASNDIILAITNPFLIPASTGMDSLIVQTRQAGLQSTMSGLTSTFARAYSHTVLSMGVGAVAATPALQESTQAIRQVTRMAKAPFFTLIALNCLYAVLGIVLAVVALASKPKVVKPLQARLSVTGLMAALFEGKRAEEDVHNMNQLFEENNGWGAVQKIAIVPSETGGWRFEKVWGT